MELLSMSHRNAKIVCALSSLILISLSMLGGLTAVQGNQNVPQTAKKLAGIPEQNSLPAFSSWTTTASNQRQCVEPLSSSAVGAYYSEPYCYGHDEADIGFISNTTGSGGNAVINFTLPKSSGNYPQGFVYSTFWIGGTTYDNTSLDKQAFF